MPPSRGFPPNRQARLWKPKTRDTNASIVCNEILPTFGGLTVDAITIEQVRDWFASMSDRPGIANRSMPVLSMMMRMAELWGYRRHNTNPCKNTRRYRMKPKERFLTAEEMARLNAVLTRDEFWCPHVVAVVRLLMLTGCRFGEIVSLVGLIGQAHPPSRLEIRAAHGLAVERRSGRDRRDPALQRRLPVCLSQPPANATYRKHRLSLGPHPQRGGLARLTAA